MFCRLGWLFLLHEGSSTAIIIPKDLKRLLDTPNSEFKIRLGGLVVGILFASDLVHVCLFLCEGGKLGLGFLHFSLQLSRLGRIALNLGSKLGHVILKLSLLCFSFAHLLIAVSLLGGIF